MNNYPTQLDICDGKYTVIIDMQTGQAECLRYGEKWRDLTGDKMVLAMFDTIVDVRGQCDELQTAYDAAHSELRRMTDQLAACRAVANTTRTQCDELLAATQIAAQYASCMQKADREKFLATIARVKQP